MTHVDDDDSNRKALLEYADNFFHDVRTPQDLFDRVVLVFGQFSAEMVDLAERGVLTPDNAAAWSWFSCVFPAIARVLLKGEPKWGTRELELQMQQAFRKVLAGSKSTPIRPAIETPPPEGERH